MRFKPARGKLAADILLLLLLTSPGWVLGTSFSIAAFNPRIWDFVVDGSYPVMVRIGVVVLVFLVFIWGVAILMAIRMLFLRRYPRGVILGGTIVVGGGEFSVERRGKVMFEMAIAQSQYERRKGAVEIHSVDGKYRLLIPSRVFSASDFESLCSALGVQGYLKRPS